MNRNNGSKRQTKFSKYGEMQIMLLTLAIDDYFDLII